MGNRKPKLVGGRKVRLVTAAEYEASVQEAKNVWRRNNEAWLNATSSVAARACDGACQDCCRICPMRRG